MNENQTPRDAMRDMYETYSDRREQVRRAQHELATFEYEAMAKLIENGQHDMLGINWGRVRRASR